MADLKVSPTCEFVVQWYRFRNEECGNTTAYWYPNGGGTMALCEGHAQRHLEHPDALGTTIFRAGDHLADG